MRARTALVFVSLFNCFTSITSVVWAASNNFDRTAYLAQAEREPPKDRATARAFLLKAADGPMQARIDGLAANVIRAWIDGRTIDCEPPFTPVSMMCRMRGLVDGADVNYATSPDGRRRWAALFVHTSPDDGNAGANELAVWKSTDGGAWAFQGVDIPWSYGHSRFADVDGRLTYVGWTGNWMEASDHKGPHAIITVSGSGKSFRVVRETETTGPLNPTPAAAEAPVLPVKTGGGDQLAYWHNGSVVMVSPSHDEISYAEPSRAMGGLVGPGSILFRGHLGSNHVDGVAYTFKRGCPPAAYRVHGAGYARPSLMLTIVGDPPVRAPGSCEVIGYRQGGASSVLRFEPMKEGDL